MVIVYDKSWYNLDPELYRVSIKGIQMSDINPEFKIINGIPMTSSLEVARVFGKRHTDVMRSFRDLSVSDKFLERNFALQSYVAISGKGREVSSPMFWMTKNGFTFLVMGFTGKKAAAYKEEYIQLFDDMLQIIQEQQLVLSKRIAAGDDGAREEGKKQRRAFTDAVQDLVEYAKAQGSENADRYYSLFTLMEYRELGLDFDPEAESFRDTLNAGQLALLSAAEMLAAKVINRGLEAGVPYKDIFQSVKMRIREAMKDLIEELS